MTEYKPGDLIDGGNPVVACRPTPDGTQVVLDECPYCGRQHIHGAPSGYGETGTYRVPHCPDNEHRPDYMLVVTGRQEPVVRAKRRRLQCSMA